MNPYTNTANKISREYLDQYLHHQFLDVGVDQRAMGYPVTPFADEARADVASVFSKLLLINVGDPFDESGHWKTHTKFFERDVIKFFGELFQIPDHWGYIASGSTEGNLQGMYVGRNYLRTLSAPATTTSGRPRPMFLFSKASHYSIKKNADILSLDEDMVELNVNDKDEMDLAQFEAIVNAIPLDRPIMVNLNIGTTMKGAVDDFDTIFTLIDKSGHKDNTYFHADMALYGLILRFFHPDQSKFQNLIDRIGSFTISGHKMLTVQMPCAIFMGKCHYVDKALCGTRVSYIGSMDRTISGSRNGMLPILLLAKVARGMDALKKDIQLCLDNCDYLCERMESIGIECHRSYNPGIIVYFSELADYISDKHQLACHDGMSHIVCMPHVNRSLIDEFIDDILAHRASGEEEKK